MEIVWGDFYSWFNWEGKNYGESNYVEGMLL